MIISFISAFFFCSFLAIASSVSAEGLNPGDVTPVPGETPVQGDTPVPPAQPQAAPAQNAVQTGNTGQAQTAGGGLTSGNKVPLKNPLGGTGPTKITTILNNIIVTLLGLTGVLALIAFIYGGVLWMISFGDSGKVEKGKKMMIWAVVGLIVVFGSYGILTLLFKAFGFATGAV